MPISTTIGTSAITRTGVCTSTTRPTSPFVGQVVYESDTFRMMAYTGSGWAAVNIAAFTSSSRPANPYQGQTIFETDTNRVTVWTGTVWRGLAYDPGQHIGFAFSRTDANTTYSSSTGLTPTVITELNVTITPKQSNSIILVEWQISGEFHHDNAYVIMKNGTIASNGYNTVAGNIQSSGYANSNYDVDNSTTPHTMQIRYVDSNVNSLTAQTYGIGIRSAAGTAQTFFLNRSVSGGSGTSNEVAVSMVTATEIAQ